MDKLREILTHKEEEVARSVHLMEKMRYAALERNDFRSLQSALRREPDEGLALIAEVKKASPSAGLIATDFDPVRIARRYGGAGADAISVLTDEKYFQGKLSYLAQVRQEVVVPILRKDFILHEFQIYESVVAGADAILLIVAALEQETFLKLLDTAYTLQLDVLVEVHDSAELERALASEAKIIGVNNRNLKTFEVDLETSRTVGAAIDDDLVFVSESGIRTAEDAAKVLSWGADAILVGESLMRSEDVSGQVDRLRGIGQD